MNTARTQRQAATSALHLVDLDNLVRGPWNADRVPAAIESYLNASDFRAGDHLVVAAEATLARSAFFQMPPGTRLLLGRGKDGADRQLLRADTPEHIAARYHTLVIGSGDNCFVDLAREVKRRGALVKVVGHVRSTARALLAATDQFISLAPSRIPA